MRCGKNALNKLSILIVSWNGAALLEPCLASLRATLGDVEVVVVDNASTDATPEVCTRYRALRVAAKQNLGFAGGNNLGLPHCTGRYILLLNNDTIVRSAESITALVDFMEANPKAGIAQPKLILTRQGGVLDACGAFLTPFGFLCHRGYTKPDSPRYATPTAIFAAKGAAMLIRREAIDAAGGFLFYDDFGSYYEETDFCHRVWLSGSEVWFIPGIPIEHLQSATADRLGFNAIWRQYLRNLLFSFATLFGGRALWRIVPGFLLLYCASTIFALIRGRFRFAWFHIAALFGLLFRVSEIYKTRKTIKPFKKETEKEIFKRVLRNPGLSYFLHSARGTLRDYNDVFVESFKD